MEFSKIKGSFVSGTFACFATPAKKHGICSLSWSLVDIDCNKRSTPKLPYLDIEQALVFA